MATNTAFSEKKYRVSGHESFACRYTWLPKVVRLIKDDPSLLSDEDRCMIELGLGKNMVRSARFWAYSAGIIRNKKNVPSITEIGELILGVNGLDQYLEDIQTLWLLHWNLSTGIDEPLLGWHYFLNRWHEPEITLSSGVRALHLEVQKHVYDLSEVTIAQHFKVFIHTYIATRGKKEKVQEDNLDSPLVELELLEYVGERESANGERESAYAFRREEKPEISDFLFAYCVMDFWEKMHKEESTLSLKSIAHGHGSPGQVFKINEDDIRIRLEMISEHSLGSLGYIESSQTPLVQKNKAFDLYRILKRAYNRSANAG